jgi:hypothetical protein
MNLEKDVEVYGTSAVERRRLSCSRITYKSTTSHGGDARKRPCEGITYRADKDDYDKAKNACIRAAEARGLALRRVIITLLLPALGYVGNE